MTRISPSGDRAHGGSTPRRRGATRRCQIRRSPCARPGSEVQSSGRTMRTRPRRLAHRVDAIVRVERRLAELFLPPPGDEERRDGWTRSIIRRAVADVLPPGAPYSAGETDHSRAFRRSLLSVDGVQIEALARPQPSRSGAFRAAARRRLVHGVGCPGSEPVGVPGHDVGCRLGGRVSLRRAS